MRYYLGSTKYIEKAKNCLSLASIFVREAPPVNKSPTEVIHVTDTTGANSEQNAPMWMKICRITLQQGYKEIILNGSMLYDAIINAAQFLLKEQFLNVLGLQSTLLLENPATRHGHDKVHAQIIFDIGNHWITASNTFAKKGEILVYDSMYIKIYV